MRHRQYCIQLGVFLTGASIMVVELSGSRLLAPHLGSSIFIWTSLIGVILSFISIGYYVGGKLSDIHQREEFLGQIVFFSGLLTASVALSSDTILQFSALVFDDLRISALLASCLLFAPLSLLLGTVLPYSMQLLLKEDPEHSGSVIGRLSAISTLGSIVGTFLAGFYLLAQIGTLQIFILCGTILVFCSLLFAPNEKTIFKLVSGIALLSWLILFNHFPRSSSDIVLDTDTQYQRVLIKDSIVEGAKVRMMLTDPHGAQSSMSLLKADEPTSWYSKSIVSLVYSKSKKDNVLVLGGGAYSLPKSFLSYFPEMKVTVVEIDPGLTSLAEQYFQLSRDPRLSILHKDARMYLNEAASSGHGTALDPAHFDVIVSDIFGTAPSIPFHTITFETLQLLKARLSDEGIVIFNVISAMTGDKSKFAESFAFTLSKVFNYNYLLHDKSKEKQATQNLLFVSTNDAAFHSSRAEFKNTFSQVAKRANAFILTDDFAPVEQLLSANLH